MTFDRYLLRNFWHSYAVCFTALFGLYVVIDLLENLDEFIKRNDSGTTLTLLEKITWYYSFQSVLFIDRAGSALTVISIAVVLILMQRSGELAPLLAAGVPMRRVLLPLVFASVLVNGLLLINQELIMPEIADWALEDRGVTAKEAPGVESAYDNETRIIIDGKHLLPAKQTILQPDFVLPMPEVVDELTILQAERAVFHRGQQGKPTGWYLIGVHPKFEDIPLTEEGRKIIRHTPKNDGIFVATALAPDQLYKRNSNYTRLSSLELIRRIQSPAFGLVSVQRLVMHLHSRMVQPLLNVIAVLITIPLMVRRESMGLVVDSGICVLLQGGLFGLVQVCQFLGGGHMIPADLAAWLPVIVGGCLCALVAGALKT